MTDHSPWTAEDGQDLAEYAILIGLLALVVVGSVTLFGTQLVALYDSIVATLPFS
ncbi:MAG: Flp family type IVb pilin [Gemmatimonadota bacterium]|nr:Flp family type IVb pilin [Gemmatimonadota bacterium]